MDRRGGAKAPPRLFDKARRVVLGCVVVVVLLPQQRLGPGGWRVPVETGSDVSQRVLRAAKQLFFVRGFFNTPLRAIANEAGTSESGVLRIYHSKTGLLRAVYAECWSDVNAGIDQALSIAAERDPDPRNLLLVVMRTVLEHYQDDPPLMNFMLSHFGFNETTGLSTDEGIDPSVDSRVRDEYHRYLERIHGLCGAVVKSRPELRGAGVTAAALGHIFTSIIYGIQAGWYMASQEPGGTTPGVTIEEVLATTKFFLYPETLAG
jgi:AcrR family transcriptional regulator